MTTQNALQKAMDVFSSIAAGSASKGKTKGQDNTGFGQIFNDQLLDRTVPKGNSKKLDAGRTDSPGWEQDSARKANSASDKKTAEPSSWKKGDGQTTSEDGKVTEKDPAAEGAVDEKAMETMNTLFQQISEVITESLGISEEQLMGALDSMGLTMQDMLQPENLKALFMQVNQIEDPMALLTQEGMAEQLTSLLDAVEQMDIPDEMPAMEAASEIVEGKADQTVDTHMDGETSEAADTSPHKESSQISITVDKEASSKEAGEQAFGRERHSGKNPGAQAENPLDVMVQNLAGVNPQNSTTGMEAQLERVQMMQNIVEQVVEQIKVNIHPDTTSMELMLNPESLGKVALSIVSSKDGQLSATFTAQNEMAKAALEGQMQTLKDNLSQQGMKVNAIEVTVSNFGQEFSQGGNMTGNGNGQQMEQKSRRRVLDLSAFNESAEDVTEEEALAAKALEQQGGSVEYTA